MGDRGLESCVLAGVVISCLGWHDYWNDRHGLNAMIGIFGLVAAGAVLVMGMHERKKL
jgi:hypothetical protein